MKILLIILSLITVLLSCKKHDENVSATISIASPTVNDTIPFGTLVKLTGSVAGTGEMHGYSISYSTVPSGTQVYYQEYDIHSDHYTINDEWTNNVTDTSQVQILVDVIKDHDGNHEKKELTVVCLPQ